MARAPRLPVGRPASRGRAETEFFMSGYKCPCDAAPYVNHGHVVVEHATWCEIRELKMRYGMCTTSNASDAATRDTAATEN